MPGRRYQTGIWCGYRAAFRKYGVLSTVSSTYASSAHSECCRVPTVNVTRTPVSFSTSCSRRKAHRGLLKLTGDHAGMSVGNLKAPCPAGRSGKLCGIGLSNWKEKHDVICIAAGTNRCMLQRRWHITPCFCQGPGAPASAALKAPLWILEATC